MPEHSSYTLVLRRSAPQARLPLGLALAALLVLAATFVAYFSAALQSAGVPVRGGAEAGQAAFAAARQERVAAPALISETSSVVVEVAAVTADISVAPEAAVIAEPDVITEPNLIEDGPALPAPAAVAPPAVIAASQPAAPPASPLRAGDRWLAEGFAFVVEGQDWDADSFANVDAALARIPARVRAMLGNRALGGMNILVNRGGRTLSGKQPYGGPANFFSTNDGRNELVLFPGQSVLTIMHELGHAYNLRGVSSGRYALVLMEPDMQGFMAAAGWRILSTPEEVRLARDHLQVRIAYEGAAIWPRMSNNDPLEDFANSFALYFFAPEELRAKSPERFAWFQASVGR